MRELGVRCANYRRQVREIGVRCASSPFLLFSCVVSFYIFEVGFDAVCSRQLQVRAPIIDGPGSQKREGALTCIS